MLEIPPSLVPENQSTIHRSCILFILEDCVEIPLKWGGGCIVPAGFDEFEL